jgi:hypothetical protein
MVWKERATSRVVITLDVAHAEGFAVCRKNGTKLET